MMLCGSLRLERYVKVFLDLSKSRCRSSCVLSAGVEWRVYTLRYSRWWNSPDQANKCHSLSKRFRLWSWGNPSLIISLQQERVVSPQLTPRQEPQHTFPTAPTACPTPKSPFQCSSILLSPEPLFLLPQARRPQGIQRCHPRLPQARRPRRKSSPPSVAHSSMPPAAADSSPPEHASSNSSSKVTPKQCWGSYF